MSTRPGLAAIRSALIWVGLMVAIFVAGPRISRAVHRLRSVRSLPGLPGRARGGHASVGLASKGNWRLEDHRGKVVVIFFWATWCAPCAQRLPVVDRLWQEFSRRKDFTLVGVTLDEDVKQAAKFCDERKMMWPELCMDSAEVQAKPPLGLNVRQLPQLVLIGRDGSVICEDLSSSDAVECVRDALAKS